jgi:hypothetical protein
MYTKFSNFMRFKIIVCLISLLFLSQKVCAEDAEELRQEILELEKVVNPFVRIFQKVSRLGGAFGCEHSGRRRLWHFYEPP